MQTRSYDSVTACFIEVQAFDNLKLYAGKFFTLTTGANERRWNKMKPKLEIVAKSFYNLY